MRSATAPAQKKSMWLVLCTTMYCVCVCVCVCVLRNIDGDGRCDSAAIFYHFFVDQHSASTFTSSSSSANMSSTFAVVRPIAAGCVYGERTPAMCFVGVSVTLARPIAAGCVYGERTSAPVLDGGAGGGGGKGSDRRWRGVRPAVASLFDAPPPLAVGDGVDGKGGEVGVRIGDGRVGVYVVVSIESRARVVFTNETVGAGVGVPIMSMPPLLPAESMGEVGGVSLIGVATTDRCVAAAFLAFSREARNFCFRSSRSRASFSDFILTESSNLHPRGSFENA